MSSERNVTWLRSAAVVSRTCGPITFVAKPADTAQVVDLTGVLQWVWEQCSCPTREESLVETAIDETSRQHILDAINMLCEEHLLVSVGAETTVADA